MANLQSHPLTLVGKKKKLGLALRDGINGLRALPQTPSTISLTGAGGEYGTGDPTFAQIQQDDWLDGRGHEKRDLRMAGYWDSLNAFTLRPQTLLPTFLPRWAVGVITVDENQPTNVAWQALYSTTRYVSDAFSSNGITADHMHFLIRKSGKPGTLTAELCANSGGDPSTVLQTATVAASAVTDTLSLWQIFGTALAQALTGSTTYHVKIYGASTDTKDHHWEVGVQAGGAGAKYSSDNSTWTSATYSLYYRVEPAAIKRRWRIFEHKQATYAVSIRDSGANSQLFINGYRHRATSATSTTLTESTASWTTNQWDGWYVKISDGTGQYQVREIASNTGTALTVDTAFDITPDATSQFVIFGGPNWYEVTGHGLTTVKDVAEQNDIMYFAHGTSVNMRRGAWNAAAYQTWADDGTNKADLLLVDQNGVDGPVMWRAKNDDVTVARSNAKAWGTNLSFGTSISVSDDTHKIWGLAMHGNLWVMKENHPYEIVNDRATAKLTQMKDQKRAYNGAGALSYNEFLYIPWGGQHLYRVYGPAPDNKAIANLPGGRVGRYVELLAHPGGLIAAVDAEDGTSGIYILERTRDQWHEIYRAHNAGARIRDLYWQDNILGRPKLWWSIDGELMYMEFPKAFDPIADTTLNYIWEAALLSSIINMNNSSLPKFFKDIIGHTTNLNGEGIRVLVQYKLDKDIHDSDAPWLDAGMFLQSPKDTVKIERGNLVDLRYRLVLQTDDADVPPIVRATVLEGFARTQVKYQYTISAETATLQYAEDGTEDHTPEEVLDFLLEAAVTAEPLRMDCRWKFAKDRLVIVEPAEVYPQWVEQDGSGSGAVLRFTVREA